MKYSIGIGISTTPNRNVLEHTLPEWYKFLPEDAALIIESDNSYTGVAATKNRLLAQLDEFDHIILADDDVKPLVKDWYLPYVTSGHKHLMYQFSLPNKPVTDMQLIYEDETIKSYTHTRGAFIYLQKEVLDIVGGFDEEYSFGYEHADLTNRIFNAGITEHRAADVLNSDKLLYCYDQDARIISSMPHSVRRNNMIKHRHLYNLSKMSKAYKVYK